MEINMFKSASDNGFLIYGGSFNPIHIGHLRLAIESRECLHEYFAKVDFVPSAWHPQKDCSTLLPFALRSRLIREAIKSLPWASCNELEKERQGPSYTLDTLLEYGREHSREKIYFLIGSEDFKLLPSWHKGLEIGNFCNLVVAPRGSFSLEEFNMLCKRFWTCEHSEIEERRENGNQIYTRLKLATGTFVFYLALPYLDISASRIRRLWLKNLNIDFLVPQGVLELLNREKILVSESWQKKK